MSGESSVAGNSADRYYPSDAFARLAALEADHWWFRSRNRIILWAIRRYIRHFESLLEIGVGTGFVLSAIQREYPAARIAGTDFHESGLQFAREPLPGVPLAQLNATQFDEVDRYDVIGAFDVLEHIPDDQRVLANIARALRPGGHLILTVPQHMWLWSSFDEAARHARRYTRQDLETKVRRAGFNVVYVSSFVSLLVPLMWWSRTQAQNQDNAVEFALSVFRNRLLERVMLLEHALMTAGLRLPVGGSLLLVAKV